MDDYYDLYNGDGDFASSEMDENISQLCEPINTILSIEDYKELINTAQPEVLDWRAFPRSFNEVRHVDVHFTFDEATRCAWKTAKEEINSILSNARKQDLLDLSDAEMPTDTQIFLVNIVGSSMFFCSI